MPDLPAAATYEVFVKYTADASRSSVDYTVVHALGSDPVSIDQSANGGVWVSLGSFAFAAGTAGSVSVPQSEDGTVAADAVRFVAESAPPGDIAWVHVDHLGTPQKMTDNTGAIVWDRVQTPFGLTHAETGTEDTDVRAFGLRRFG